VARKLELIAPRPFLSLTSFRRLGRAKWKRIVPPPEIAWRRGDRMLQVEMESLVTSLMAARAAPPPLPYLLLS